MTETYSLEEQLACVQRELAMRRAVYLKRVQTGRMTAAEAEREIGRMQAVYDTIAKLFGQDVRSRMMLP